MSSPLFTVYVLDGAGRWADCAALPFDEAIAAAKRLRGRYILVAVARYCRDPALALEGARVAQRARGWHR